MGLKPIIFFLSACFVVLISLDAIADDISSLDDPNGASAPASQDEGLNSADNTSEVPEKCDEEKNKINGQKPTASAKETSLKENPIRNSNLSFNFVYYILYKFKYIDRFGLSTPGKSQGTKNQENIVWH